MCTQTGKIHVIKNTLVFIHSTILGKNYAHT